MQPPPKNQPAINQLLEVMAGLRSPEGCPWDREQDHMSLRFHAVEEVYELIDSIEANDEKEMVEELGDLLLQVVFHCQLAAERNAFDFDQVAQGIVDKLVHRHPHVFGESDVKTVDAVWTQWEALKKEEKEAYCELYDHVEEAKLVGHGCAQRSISPCARASAGVCRACVVASRGSWRRSSAGWRGMLSRSVLEHTQVSQALPALAWRCGQIHVGPHLRSP